MKSSLASRKKEKLGVILSLAVLMGAQGSNESSDPKYPWSFPDFSATQVVHGASYDLTAKVYRSGSTVRVDTSAAISVLFIPSSSKVYSLTTYPDGSHQCVVMRPDQARMMPSPLEFPDSIREGDS